VPIGPDDVGRRVVLRHRLPDGRATDVLGELLTWTVPADTPDGRAEQGHVVVATARGPVRVALRDVLLGKVVPPAPVRRERALPRLTVTELHAVMADGWQPLEREDYGGWRLRAAEGFTGRANSVLPLGPPPVSLPEAVAHAERWYAARGLPARFCLPWELGAGPGEPHAGHDPLDQELTRRGYTLDTPTLCLIRPTYSPTAGLLAESRFSSPESAGKAASGEYDVRVRDEPDEGFLGLYRYRGQDLPAVAARVLVSAPAQAFVSVLDRATGRTVAVGRVASAQGWSGVSAVEVAAGERRRGLGSLVMSELVRWGAACGDRAAYLQVARSNTAARALYERQGWAEHSGYHYRIQPH
jgi:ribosomal protein S18 acetylase RimI-like enzyme